MKNIFKNNIFRSIKKIINYINKKVLSVVDFWAIKKYKNIRLNTLLIVRLDGIGDYILFRNFIEILKKSKKYCNYKITLCGNIIWKDLAETYDKSFLDNFIWIDRRKFNWNPIYRFKILRYINQYGFEIAIQPTYSRRFFHGDSIIKASGAKERIGSEGDLTAITKRLKNISDGYYTKLLSVKKESIFEFYRNKEFFEYILGEKIKLSGPNFKVNNETTKVFLNNPYAVIFPGVGSKLRRWQPEKFAKIADYIYEKYGLEVLIAGSRKDNFLTSRIINMSKNAKIIDITGVTMLTELVQIIKNAKILVSNETCAVHIAAAVGTKTICISMGFRFGRFDPYPKEIFNKVFYVYPNIIQKKIYDYKYLIEKYRYSLPPSTIDTIPVHKVKESISDLMVYKNI
jgi:ADP-heptose:LPS heptosyltransferase